MVSCTKKIKTYQALKGMARNDEKGAIDYEWASGFIVSQELIDILCVEPSETSKAEEERDEEIATEADNMIDIVNED